MTLLMTCTTEYRTKRKALTLSVMTGDNPHKFVLQATKPSHTVLCEQGYSGFVCVHILNKQ